MAVLGVIRPAAATGRIRPAAATGRIRPAAAVGGIRLAAAVGVAVAASLLAACGGGGSTPAPQSLRTSVQVSLGNCGAGWTNPRPGQQTLELHNTDIAAAEAYLVDPASGAVYAAVEPLGAGRTADMPVTLAPGDYALRCAVEDQDVVTGPTVTVPSTGWTSGAGAEPSPVLPVSQGDLIGPTKAYEAYVAGALPGLSAQVATLRADLAARDVGAAQADWLAAHQSYERLGAAYGAFGDADGAINGVPTGLPGGVADPGFTGFHRIEYDLWHGNFAADLLAETDALAASIASLQTDFASAEIDPRDVSIRAHEITENALEFELTGRTDFGSGSELATVRANLDGTREVLAVLQPLLQDRYPDLPELQAHLDRTAADLDAQHVAGRWTPLDDLPQAQRELIDSDVSDLSERLASVASICEPRRQQ